MNSQELELIRKIYIKKQDLRAFPALHKKLFRQYFPHLDYSLNKSCNWWHCCVFGDFCGDLMGENVPFIEEEKAIFLMTNQVRWDKINEQQGENR